MSVHPDLPLKAPKRLILDLPVCEFTWDEAFSFADEMSRMSVGQTVISFFNANTANLMMGDAAYRAILSRHTILPDGHGVDIASRLFYGKVFPANLNGTDFVPALLTFMAKPMRVALVGGSKDVLSRATDTFRRHTPWHIFLPVSDGYFDESESDAVMAKVHALAPDILIVAMGSPKQEKWVDRYVGPSHARLVISVGALFDFMAGEFPRAPVMMRRLRLEWVYRLVQEPGRLWRRYLLGIPLFLYYIVRHRLTGGERGQRARRPGASI